jgi:hypothetical protein
MSSEPRRQPAPGSQPRRRRAADPEPAKHRELTDAKAMRALAHPVRMELLRLFGFHDTLTATQASELLGESPANCAFHLRTLAKYGYLAEAGGGRGRERPWAIASRAMNISARQEDPVAALAAEELTRAVLDRWLAHAREVYGSPQSAPGWEQASGMTLQYVFMTAEETENLRAEIAQLIERYEPRRRDQALRPDGAAPVEWTLFAAPVEEWFRHPGEAGQNTQESQ